MLKKLFKRRTRDELVFDMRRYFGWYKLYETYNGLWRETLFELLDEDKITQDQYNAIMDGQLDKMRSIDIDQIVNKMKAL